MTDIDQTSLAASSIGRRDSLEKHLQHRPDPEDLRSRHILVDTNMAPYAAALHINKPKGLYVVMLY